MRKLFVVVAGLLVLDTVLQLYFAALGHFSTGSEELFGLHGFNGANVLRVLALLTIIAAALARAGRRTIWLSVLVLVLVLFQTVLFIIVGTAFNIGPDSEEIPVGASILLGFHGLNGLAIIALSAVLFNRALRHDRAARRTVQDEAPVAAEPVR